MSAAPTMQVKIYAPFRVYFDEPASSLSGINETGPFDILPRHKNFMSLLQEGIITVRRENQPDFKLKINRGIMHVSQNKTTVFLDI